jgi:hypothetical protein
MTAPRPFHHYWRRENMALDYFASNSSRSRCALQRISGSKGVPHISAAAMFALKNVQKENAFHAARPSRFNSD